MDKQPNYEFTGTPLLRLRDAGKPIVYVVHHPLSADRDVTSRESSGFASLLWQLRYWPLVRGQRAFCTSGVNVLSVSQTVARRLIDEGAPASSITVVPNGVDGEVFTPGDLAASEFDVIALGSFMHPRKGFRYVREAYKKLAAKGLRIADVGRRSEAQHAELRNIPQVRSFGTVEHDQLLALLRSSSTLMSTSLYEGFGLSLIEALACGRPAFAFDAGATGEVLQSIDPTLVVPVRDVSALVTRVESFLALPTEERVAKGQRYRSEVLARYSLKHSADALLALYKRARKAP